MMFMWGAGGILMMLMMLAFWAGIIAAFVIGVRWLVGRRLGFMRSEEARHTRRSG